MSQSCRTVLRVCSVHKSFAAAGGTTVALDGIDLDIEAGGFVSIIGPSGCGKSTLLQIMAGLATPTSGEVFYGSSRVQGPPADVLYVFQQYTRSLFPWKTVERNVAFGLENKGTMSRAEIAGRTRELIGLVKLAGFERHYPWQLSGGMQQRVAIARAIAYQPAILLMDEPFASVDAQTRADLQDIVLAVWQAHRSTVLFVTHDIDESVYLSGRVIVLSRAPATVAAEISIDLPRPRDQIETRASSAFVERRADVARLIRRPPGSASRR
jgi:NitT/TauT family transport system ATP-binding protein